MKTILEELRDFDTALIANTIGYLDPTPAHEWYMGGSIQSVTPALGPTVGVAVVCEADSSSPDNEPDMAVYWEQLEEMGRAGAPTVWVVKAIGSRPDHECILGDGMAKTLYAQGCVGIVTDGGVRDVAGLLNTSFAAYCRGTVIHHTHLRFRRASAVQIGGIEIRTGDVIHANAEGVIKIPSGCLDRLANAAILNRAFEHKAHLVFRRTDLTIEEKRQQLAKIFAESGLKQP